MEYTIRQAHLSDLAYVYNICLKTGLNGSDASAFLSDKYIVGQYYAAPYLHFEIDSCFILERQTIPLGYIIGTSSITDFNKWMNEKWLPKIRKNYPADLNPKSDFEKFLIDTIHSDCKLPGFLHNFPSQLHIDILPEAQKMGFGRKLISNFIRKQKEKGSSGLHLGVGLENTDAIQFYEAIGFSELKVDSKALIMGLLFD